MTGAYIGQSLKVAVDRQVNCPDEISLRAVGLQKSLEIIDRLMLKHKVVIFNLMSAHIANHSRSRQLVNIDHRIHDSRAPCRTLGRLLIVVTRRNKKTKLHILVC